MVISLDRQIHPPYTPNHQKQCLINKVFEVTIGDNRFELPELNGEMLFRGKYLDLGKLDTLQLLPQKAEAGSEWDAFLDEWESAVDRSYEEQINYLEKSIALRSRVSPPRSQGYRISLLETKAKEARTKLAAIDEKVCFAYELIESSEKRFDLHRLTFGAVKLKEAIGQMQMDRLFSEKEIENYQNLVDLTCQRTIQLFDTWLPKQAPRGRTTKDASDFERFMRETAINMKKLGLSEQEGSIESHTANAIRQINLLAEAQTLAENIEGWLTQHSALRAQRVADLRNYADTAKEHMKKVSEMLRRLPVPALETTKVKLNDFIKANKQREKEFMDRFSRMFDVKFNINKIDELMQETDDLERIFERCDSDINDLRTMRRALNFYKDVSIRLFDGNLSEYAFSSLWAELNNKCCDISDDEPPWMPNDVMPIIYNEALQKREDLGLYWLAGMENETSNIEITDIANASNLHDRLQQIPGYLTKSQQKRAKELKIKVEAHLNTLKVEWLLEKYRELGDDLQKAFLLAIGI